MLTGIHQERIDALMKTTLQFNPDYYRILDLTLMEQDEESKEEKYGLDA